MLLIYYLFIEKINIYIDFYSYRLKYEGNRYKLIEKIIIILCIIIYIYMLYCILKYILSY